MAFSSHVTPIDVAFTETNISHFRSCVHGFYESISPDNIAQVLMVLWTRQSPLNRVAPVGLLVRSFLAPKILKKVLKL